MAIPLLNERDRRGTKIRVSTSDWTTIARFVPNRAGVAHAITLQIAGFRVLTAAGPQPAAFFYTRRALFVTDSTGAVTQIGATGTLGTDLETDAGSDVSVTTDGTNIDVKVTCSWPTDWSVNASTIIVDQFNVG